MFVVLRNGLDLLSMMIVYDHPWWHGHTFCRRQCEWWALLHNLAVDITTAKDVISTQDHDTSDSIFSLYYGIIWVCHIHHFISNIYRRQSCCYKLGLKYFINPDIYPFIFAANYLNSLNQNKPRNHNIIHFKFKVILKLLLSRLLCDHFRVLSSSKIIARLSI